MVNQNPNLEEMIEHLGNEPEVESVVTFLGGSYKKWGQYLSNFKEDPHNLGFIQQVSREGHQEAGIEEDQTNVLDPEKTASVQDFIKGTQDVYGRTILDYAKDNIGKILEISSPKVLYHDAISMKPYKIDNEAHDSIVKIHNKFLEAYTLLSSGSEELIENYIMKTMLKKAFVPVFLQTKAYDKEYLVRIMQNIAQSREYELKKNFKNGEELDKSKLISYINNNLSKSNDEEKSKLYTDSTVNLYDQIKLAKIK
jgi:hypothetical protein